MTRLILLIPLLALACVTSSALPPLATATPDSIDTGREVLQFESPTFVPTTLPVAKKSICLIVTADTLHLRKDSTEHSQALDWLPRDMQITGLSRQDDWWFVDTGSKQGWVKAEFVEVCK